MSPNQMPEDAETYLQQLGRELQPLPVGDAAKITEEIRSHLLDRAAVGPETLRAAITQLGAPRELGRSFVDDWRLSGALEQGPSWRILLVILRRAAKSFAAVAIGTVGVILYVLAAGFVIVAAMKPISPHNVGAWAGPDGNLANFGVIYGMDHNAPELLGWWIIPISLVAAALCYLLAAFVMRTGGRLLLKRR